jgi:hypothetical protein
MKVTRIVNSSLLRALGTAQTIAKALAFHLSSALDKAFRSEL